MDYPRADNGFGKGFGSGSGSGSSSVASSGFGRGQHGVKGGRGFGKKQAQWGLGVSPRVDHAANERQRNRSVLDRLGPTPTSSRPQVGYGSLYDDDPEVQGGQGEEEEDGSKQVFVRQSRRKTRSRGKIEQGGSGQGMKRLVVTVEGGSDAETLQSYFERFGPVAQVRVQGGQDSAVVTMATANAASTAAAEKDQLCEGKKMRVVLDVSQEQKNKEKQALQSGLLKERAAILKRLEQKEKRKREKEQLKAEESERKRKTAERGLGGAGGRFKPKPKPAPARKVVRSPKAAGSTATPSARKTSQTDAYIVGTCQKMCPIEETSKRYNENGIHLLERTHPEVRLDAILYTREVDVVRLACPCCCKRHW